MSIKVLSEVGIGRWGEANRELWKGRDVVLDIYSCRFSQVMDVGQ